MNFPLSISALRPTALVITSLICALPTLAKPASADDIDDVLADTALTSLAKPIYPSAQPLVSNAPTTFKAQDLANRPERWPERVALKTDIRFDTGNKLSKGTTLTMGSFDGKTLRIKSGKQSYSVGAKDTDFVEAANKQWALLTSAQRAVDYKLIANDISLWPASVKLTDLVWFEGDKGERSLYAGSEFEVMEVTAEKVAVYVKDENTRLTISFGSTDLLAGARQRVLLEVGKRPSRVARFVEDILIDSDGKTAKPNFEETDLFLFYYGAGWCPPCREWAPQMVKYIDAIAAKNPKLSVVFVDADAERENMLDYMQSNKMPWAGVPKEDYENSAYLTSVSRGVIPRLLLVDRHGSVLSNSYSDGTNLGPLSTIIELNQMLNAGWGR